MNHLPYSANPLTRLGHVPRIESREIPIATSPPVPTDTTSIYFKPPGTPGRFYRTPLYLLSELRSGHRIGGPSAILDDRFYLTILIEPGCHAEVSPYGHIHIHVPPPAQRREEEEIPVKRYRKRPAPQRRLLERR